MLSEKIENYLTFINDGYTVKYINAFFVTDDDMVVSYILYKKRHYYGFFGGDSNMVVVSLKRILWYDRYAKLIDILNTDSLI